MFISARRPWTSLVPALSDQVAGFFAAPATAHPLAFLRIGLAAALFAQAVSYRSALPELYGSLGIVQAPVVEALTPGGVPRVRWLAEALAPFGVSEDWTLRGLYAAYLSSLAGLALGWRTRLLAIAACLLYLTLKYSSQLSVYGAYEFGHIGLFYCACLPVGHAWSLDRWSGRLSGAPSADARLGLRLLQLHLCIVYLSSGVLKASGPQWWNGEAVWRALMRPDFGQLDFSWLASAPWLAVLACWATLFVELGYAILIWPRRTRRAMTAAVIGMHVGIAVTMGLWSFSAVMIVLNVAALCISGEGSDRSPGSAD
jgi:hypothetical protein